MAPTGVMLLIMSLVLLGGLPASRAWLRVDKPCDPECTKHGNCNKEFGVCECPPGWTGSACNISTLNACRSNLSRPDSRPFWTDWPRSCECLRQMLKTFLMPTALTGKPPYYWSAWDWDKRLCFERTSLPPEQQHSDMPDLDEPNVVWYQGDLTSNGTRTFKQLDDVPEEIRNGYSKGGFVGLKHCRDRCNDRGACYRHIHNTTECNCGSPYEGPTCLETPYVWGLANCSGHGRDIGRWCHCEPGYWGRQCRRSAAWAPDPAKPAEMEDRAFNRTHLRIFKYDVPWWLANIDVKLTNKHITDIWPDYGMEHYIIEELLRDDEVYTENPYEANVFLLDGDFFFYEDGYYVNSYHVQQHMYWIRQHYPVAYARHRGKDHAIIIVADWGGCSLTDNVTSRLIKIAHFGPVENHKLALERNHTYSRLYNSACYNPARDVLVPYPDRYEPERMELWDSILKAGDAPLNRTYLLFWTGRLFISYKHEMVEKGDSELEWFSGGARQGFVKYFTENGTRSKYPNIKYRGNMREFYPKSHFCYVPAGIGVGSYRLPYCFQTGCIPVIVMDYNYQPWWDILPYPSFSVRVRHDDIPHLPEILSSISDAQRARLRRNMHQYRHYFSRHTQHGGLGYHALKMSLHKRINNLWGVLY